MLKEKNRFNKEGAFYIHDQSSGVFSYSDGDEVEKYLKSGSGREFARRRL